MLDLSLCLLPSPPRLILLSCLVFAPSVTSRVQPKVPPNHAGFFCSLPVHGSPLGLGIGLRGKAGKTDAGAGYTPYTTCYTAHNT
ncbi:hypothetical protein LX36DRAFT_660744 [Colletotrichum falcatum]|nr:hypothetical protein LX36DRAFT_660744 [Colletotrichum falcatum]